MKRCPQCEFIYEDDQSLCDMDGILLVFDSLNLPKPKASSKSNWKNRLVPAVAALVLGTVFLLVYYVSTHQRPGPLTTPGLDAVNATQPTSNKANAPSQVSDTQSANESEAKSTDNAKPLTMEAASESKPKASSTSASKDSKQKTNPKSAPKTQRSANAPQDDSKIGSLIRKTGRLLKKPFKH
jgi:cytoskeletal protein RodZ